MTTVSLVGAESGVEYKIVFEIVGLRLPVDAAPQDPGPGSVAAPRGTCTPYIATRLPDTTGYIARICAFLRINLPHI